MSPSSAAATALIALGSNLGDRARLIAAALERLDRLPGTRVVASSALYETDPIGPPGQPPYLNAAAAVRTSLDPRGLLEACLRIETDLGRVRGERWGPRTIDLDLLLHGRANIDEPGLRLPHPRLTERAFVLVPLAEIAPEALVGGRTVAAWAREADAGGVRRWESADRG